MSLLAKWSERKEADRQVFAEGRLVLYGGDCLEVLKTMADASDDSVCCDPPYGLSKQPDVAEVLRHWLAGDDYVHRGSGFMGKSWDSFVPGPSIWREAFRVLKPGGHLVAFFGTRTYDLGSLAIRLANFEIRDQLAWVAGSGFPKSHDVSKGIDKLAGATRTEVVGKSARHNSHARGSENSVGFQGGVPDLYAPVTEAARQWEGWGTALKPAWEPICLARKPLVGTVAANVMEHGVGALNVDGCRVGTEGGGTQCGNRDANGKCLGHPDRRGTAFGVTYHAAEADGAQGRWPANLLHDGSDEVVGCFPQARSAGLHPSDSSTENAIYGKRVGQQGQLYADKGSAARFFYAAKASAKDRAGSKHPTVKPVSLMRWLCRLITPPGGTVLDPFAGSGTTGQAALEEGFKAVLVEREKDYLVDIAERLRRMNDA